MGIAYLVVVLSAALSLTEYYTTIVLTSRILIVTFALDRESCTFLMFTKMMAMILNDLNYVPIRILWLIDISYRLNLLTSIYFLITVVDISSSIVFSTDEIRHYSRSECDERGYIYYSC